MAKEETHRWKFARAGGVDQVVIRDAADIINLPRLDQKLWVTLACPTRGLEFDPKTLDLIDIDHDGRIRAPEIIQAVEWVRFRLKDLNLLLQAGDAIPLAAINEADPEGAQILKAARRVLQHLGRAEDAAISLPDVLSGQAILKAAPLNGDGILVPESASDPELSAAITEIIPLAGSVPDRSGKPGLDQAAITRFFAECAAFLAWSQKPGSDPALLPLGDRTAAASAALLKVKPKVDDYFTRGHLAEYHSLATTALNPAGSDYQAFAPKLLTGALEEIAALPLAITSARQPLPLADHLNPAWVDAIAAFRRDAVEPLLGSSATAIEEKDWAELQRRLAPYQAWQAARPATAAAQINPDRLRQLCEGSLQSRLLEVLQADAELAADTAQVAALEKLLRLKRDLLRLLQNFVSFSDFYARRGAIFQAGTLYLDARSCDLTLRVNDAAKHAGLAGMAKAFLAYCDCTRPGEKMTIAAAFTAGDSDFLLVGRNGLFYDRQGRDWDATIVKIIENPISIRQAFFSPYKKFVRMVEEQVAKRAAASDAEAQGKLSSVATSVATVDKAAPAKPAQPAPTEKRKIDVGTVAAIGVALGSISAVLVGIFAKFVDLGWWIPIALLGIVLAISGPSMLIAWLKLRQRNLGPILDANGWAVNGRMKINVPFGGALSKTAALPPGTVHQIADPYAQDHTLRNLLIFLTIVGLAFLVAWRFDYF